MIGLLDGPARLGPLPRIGADQLIARLEQANLLGRGGAGFPAARKWRAVRERAGGKAVVLVNGAEGEPLSRKDRTLMASRPHLVIDGALLAAGAVGAADIIFYVGREHRAALAALGRALGERQEPIARRSRLVEAPSGYVTGEESAAVHFLNAGDPRPTSVPPRPYEAGVGGRPTLVQNVESLAMAALIARGVGGSTTLVTSGGAVARPGVHEVPLTATVADIAREAGGLTRPGQAALVGGYFGAWARVDEVWGLPIEPRSLRARGLNFGCGILYFPPATACGVDAAARIMRYLASQSARQCGPCVFGLGATAAACERLARLVAQPDDLQRLVRWSGQLAGRGACKHPDGATGLLRSALDVFSHDFAAHQRRRCIVAEQTLTPRAATAMAVA